MEHKIHRMDQLLKTETEELIETEKKRVRIPPDLSRLPNKIITNKYQNLRILGLVADYSACGFYRIINPIHMLALHGAEIVHASSQNLANFLRYDVIFAPRQYNPDVYDLLGMAALEHKLIIYEVDDDLEAVLPSSPAFPTFHQGSKELTYTRKTVELSHGMITTTPEIAKRYSTLNSNLRVIGNYIDFSFRDWGYNVGYTNTGAPIITPKTQPRPEIYGDLVILGWAGGSTHQEDLKILGPVIRGALERNPNLGFSMYSSVKAAVDLCRDYRIPPDRMFYVESRHFQDYPPGLFGMDIQLAPLYPCQFNLAKSWLKILEGWAVGSAMIVSNLAPYARLNRLHPDSFLSIGAAKHCFQSWDQAIDLLVQNKDLREHLQAKGKHLVTRYHSLEGNIDLWPTAINSIASNIRHGVTGKPEGKQRISEAGIFGDVGRNKPCPCGSGEKYKECCVDAWG